jgi:hypothetical protein
MANISELYRFHRIIVHKIKLSDVEDPDLYVAEPIYQWQQTPQGKFVMEHGQDVSWQREIDMSTMGYAYSILAEFEPKKLTEYYLRFGKE